MKNSTIRKTIEKLANAPAIAGREIIKELPAEERADALRLLKAVGIKLTEEGGKNNG